MECKVERNKEKCNCSYQGCPKNGICCDCISYHRRSNQLPACFFHDKYERSYDRSVENFIKMVQSVGMRTD